MDLRVNKQQTPKGITKRGFCNTQKRGVFKKIGRFALWLRNGVLLLISCWAKIAMRKQEQLDEILNR